MAMVVAGFTGGEAEELRRAMGFKRSEKRMQQIEEQAARGHGAQRHHRRDRRRHRAVDHVVRALRLPRVARGELCAHRLCQRVSQGLLPGRLLRRAAEQPADGLLPSGHAGQGRAAPRRPLHGRRRADARTGTAAWRTTARSASACGTCAACAKRWAADRAGAACRSGRGRCLARAHARHWRGRRRRGRAAGRCGAFGVACRSGGRVGSDGAHSGWSCPPRRAEAPASWRSPWNTGRHRGSGRPPPGGHRRAVPRRLPEVRRRRSLDGGASRHCRCARFSGSATSVRTTGG